MDTGYVVGLVEFYILVLGEMGGNVRVCNKPKLQ